MADERTRAPAWWWPFVGIACLLSFLLHGYTLHGGDNDFWLPVIEASAHPELYPGDPHVASGHRSTSLHFEALAIPVRVLGLEWAMFAAYLGAHALLFGAFASIARSLVRDASAAALSVLLLILARPLGGTATLTVESSLLPRFAAGSLALLAIALALKSRPLLAGLVLGLVLLEHPLTAVGAFAAIALRPVVLRQGVAAAAKSIVVGVLVGSPLILRFLAHRGAATSAPGATLSDEEWWAITRRVTSFPFTDLWSDAAWLAVLAAAALLVIGLAAGARPREGAALLAGPALVMLVGTPFVMLSGSVSLVALQPMRALLLVVLLALALAGEPLRALLRPASAPGRLLPLVGGVTLASLLGGWLGLILLSLAIAGIGLALRARSAGDPPRALAFLAGAAIAAFAFIGPWREAALEMAATRPLRLALVIGAGLLFAALPATWRARPLAIPATGLALVVGLMAWVGIARVEWPWTRPSDPTAVIALWARENTPVTTRFAVPPSMRGFRAISRRTVLLEGTDEANALFSREFAAGFLERSRRFGTAASLEDVVEEVRAGRADVLVLPLGVDAPGLERIHSDEHFAAWARPLSSP